MNIFQQIDSLQMRLSRSDLVLIEQIKKSPSSFCDLPIAKLAQKCSVSEATITRFVRKIGFENLQSFKLALAQDLAACRENYTIISSDICCHETIETTMQKLLANNIAALEQTVHTLNEKSIAHATDLLLNCKKALFIGLGNSGFIANDSAYKFMRIGIDAKGTENSHLMMIAAALLAPNDLIVAITHSGRSPEIITAIDFAIANGIKVIAITADKHSPAAQKADLALCYAAHESMLETGSITTKLSQIFIIDLIYTQLVKQLPNRTVFFKHRTMAAIDELHKNK